jgi:hypothetical protein
MKKLILKVSIITLGVSSAASAKEEYKETDGSYEQNTIARQLYCASVARSANTWGKIQEAISIIHEGKAYTLVVWFKIKISKGMIDITKPKGEHTNNYELFQYNKISQ